MMNNSVLMLFSLLLATQFAVAQSAEVRKQHYYTEDGVALEGYDPVAYLTQNEAIEGKSDISFTHEGITYYFTSEENKAAFENEPEKFSPAYGGWCAYAVAQGKKMEPDPETFIIQEGKLYLFYNSFFNNTLPKWNKSPEKLKIKADQGWAEMLEK